MSSVKDQVSQFEKLGKVAPIQIKRQSSVSNRKVVFEKSIAHAKEMAAKDPKAATSFHPGVPDPFDITWYKPPKIPADSPRPPIGHGKLAKAAS